MEVLEDRLESERLTKAASQAAESVPLRVSRKRKRTQHGVLYYDFALKELWRVTDSFRSVSRGNGGNGFILQFFCSRTRSQYSAQSELKPHL